MVPNQNEHTNPEFCCTEDYDPVAALAEYYDTLEHHGEWHDMTN